MNKLKNYNAILAIFKIVNAVHISAIKVYERIN